MNRDLEDDVVPCCRELGIGIVAYGKFTAISRLFLDRVPFTFLCMCQQVSTCFNGGLFSGG